ncbi:MAG TPA: tetratricopeptide repeat protein [Burkholderiaceae bacterium]|jgi:tetratricopeptide (TPR) repeat protein|nr:tetratricopeptide repeat protein [Burkholderiaceae bacterium]
MKPLKAPRARRHVPGGFRPLAALAAVAAVTITGCAAVDGLHAAEPALQPRTASPTAQHAAAGGRGPSISQAGGAAGQRARRPLPVGAGDEAEDLPKVDLTPQLIFQLLASEIAAQRGQAGSATATYLSLAQKTRDPRLARRATELALSERSLERAMQAAQLWRELSPGSSLAAQTLETLWLSTGRFGDARPLILQRLERARADGSVGDVYEQLQRNLMRGTDRKGALALLEDIASADPQVPQARLAVANLAHAAEQHDRAALEAGKALALLPDDEAIVVATARFVQASSAGTAGAVRVLQAYLDRFPKALEARFQYARLLAGDGRTAEARREMELALREDPDSPAILFSLAQLAYQNKQPAAAADYLQRYIGLADSVPRDNNPAYLFLSQIAEDQNKLPQAIEWLEKVNRGEQAMQALMRRAVLMSRDGQIESARNLLRNTTAATSRERVQLIAVEAQLLRDANRAPEAFEVLDKALERQPDNPELLYDHAMLAERIDRLAVMETSLRKLIQLKPDHAHAYNALGYSLAERNVRLDEAQTLIARALQLMPDDAHILDSMGWVLYRRGQFDKAAEYLRRAYQLRPEAEIAAHLGEVLWAMGRNDEARKLWADARGREPNNQILKETLARLNVAL